MASQAVNERSEALLADARKVGPADLTICGGSVAADDLAPWLRDWRLTGRNMDWTLWEWYDDIELSCGNHTPERTDLLERARMFGLGGDLALRRDGDRVYWHFIGPAEATPPDGISFWSRNPDAWFWESDGSALLWGLTGEAGQRREARVAGARLTYPQMGRARTSVRFKAYSAGGQVAFVWWQQLEGHDHAR